MGRFSAGCLTGAGSTSLPVISLYGLANNGPILREVGLFNTSTTDVAVKLVRLTTTGTQGSALTNAPQEPDDVAVGAAFGTHTVAPTLGDDLGYRAVLGAAKGAGVIFTFGANGIRIPKGTANGIGVIVENGTGQAVQAYLVWD